MKRLISLIIALLLMVGSAVSVYAATIEELEERQRELEEQNAAYQAELDSINSKVSEQQSKVNAIVGKVQTVNEQIAVSREKLEALEKDIAEKQELIDEKNAEIEAGMNTLRSRLKAIYISGDVSSLEIILGAKNFTDFLDKLQVVQYVSNHDEALINEIQAQLDVIAEEKKALEDDKKAQEEEQKNLEAKQEELNTLLEENKEILAGLEAASSDAQLKLELSEEELSNLSAELQEEYRKRQEEAKRQEEEERQRQQQAQQSGSSSYTPPANAASSIAVPDTGGYVWPTPGFYYLSSLYEEWRGSRNHGAIDIAGAGIMNSPVYAAASGTVISCCSSCGHNWGKYYSCGCGGGYGNYVWLDHGNGKETIYGHLTSLTVGLGDYVSAGQLIGYVGTTGYSTGPHLHFECHYNGMKYDPMTEY